MAKGATGKQGATSIAIINTPFACRKVVPTAYPIIRPGITVYHRDRKMEALVKTTDAIRSVLVSRDPEVHSGKAVFVGTRVPVQSLVDWLKDGHSIDEYLNSSPSVRRELVIAALASLREALLAE